MMIMGKHFDKRGVSVVIAALLLIAIAVAAAILLYVFAIGLIGGLQSSGGQQTKQQLILEAYNWVAANLVLNLRNVGSAAIDLNEADFFLNGVTHTATGYGSCGATGVLAPQDPCPNVTISPTISVTGGVAYTLKIVTADGAVFSYAVIRGQAG